MGCNILTGCKPVSLGTVSVLEWKGHSTWELDLSDVMPRYGKYFQVPCLTMWLTWFESVPLIGAFRGEISMDDYGQRQARLLLVHTGLPAQQLWSATYDPSQCGSEPYDDLYSQHAIASTDRLDRMGM